MRRFIFQFQSPANRRTLADACNACQLTRLRGGQRPSAPARRISQPLVSLPASSIHSHCFVSFLLSRFMCRWPSHLPFSLFSRLDLWPGSGRVSLLFSLPLSPLDFGPCPTVPRRSLWHTENRRHRNQFLKVVPDVYTAASVLVVAHMRRRSPRQIFGLVSSAVQINEAMNVAVLVLC